MAATETPVFAGDQHIIERPRLTKMLDESTAKVILLLAPAGYGKTTLARQWLKDKPHVWYRASEADADVAALAIGLATAASHLVPGADARIRERMLAVQDPEEEASVFADIVAEDLSSIPADAWIAIDDYHSIVSSVPSDAFVQRTVEVVACRFILTSRLRPGWSTARDVIYGTDEVITREALAMTNEEVAAAIGTSAKEAPVLFREALGWPAVVGLAARVGPTRLETHAHDLPRDLYDFFAQELWHGLTEDRRWQLAQLGLVAPFPWRACVQVFGDSLGGLLEEASGGWVTRETDHIAVHPLFRRFLRSRFESFDSKDRSTAMRRLLEILTSELEWDQAMSLAFDLDAEAVASTLEKCLDDMLSAGRLSTLQRWNDEAQRRRLDSPIFDLCSAELAYRRGQYALAELRAARGAERFKEPNLRARSLNRAGQSARRLERLSTARDLHRRARSEGAAGPALHEAVIGEILTALDAGQEDLADLLTALDLHGGSPTEIIRSAATKLQVALRCGGVVEAIESAATLAPLLGAVTDPLARTSFLYIRAGGLNACGRFHEALRTLALLTAETDAYRIDFARDVIAVQRAFAETGLRNFGHARSLASEVLARSAEQGDFFSAAAARILEVRLSISSHSGTVPSFQSSVTRTETAGVNAEYLGWLALAEACFGSRVEADKLVTAATREYMDAEVRTLLAWTHVVMNAGDREMFSATMELTQRLGYINTFVAAYRGKPALLETAKADLQWRDTVSTILGRANDLALAQEYGLSAKSAETRRYKLTKREIDVYRLMVEGLSNRLIARRLFITEPTAKLHVRHILQKLGSRSRAEAAAKWHDVLDNN